MAPEKPKQSEDGAHLVAVGAIVRENSDWRNLIARMLGGEDLSKGCTYTLKMMEDIWDLVGYGVIQVKSIDNNRRLLKCWLGEDYRPERDEDGTINQYRSSLEHFCRMP